MTTTAGLIRDFLLSSYEEFLKENNKRPFFLGLSGAQGSGKTSAVNVLARMLREEHSLNTAVFSIDDIYHPFETLQALVQKDPLNCLYSNRGEPGTHDIPLGVQTLESLKQNKPTQMPFYDKSLYQGMGDRTAVTTWTQINPPVDIVIFEGWCVGFRALPEAKVLTKQQESFSCSTLRNHRLQDLLTMNKELQAYHALWAYFDAFCHLDTADLDVVYTWRLQQEHDMIAKLGSGMTDDGVVKFVDTYMPAYELYAENLRKGLLRNGRQLRLSIDRARNVADSVVIQ